MKHKENRQPRDLYYQVVKMTPKGMRDDLMKVYTFVTTVQSHAVMAGVDQALFAEFIRKWNRAKKTIGNAAMHEGNSDSDIAIRQIAYIVHRYKCDPKGVDVYLKSVKADIEGVAFATTKDQLSYLEQSVEMLGRIVASVVGIREGHLSQIYAQARAFQQAEFIRDCGEDSLNHRLYFPKEDLVMFGLKSLDQKEANKKPAEFREFMQYQASVYAELQKESQKLLKYVPIRLRIALLSARDTNDWIVENIANNPTVVFEKKLRPNKLRFAYIQASRKVNF